MKRSVQRLIHVLLLGLAALGAHIVIRVSGLDEYLSISYLKQQAYTLKYMVASHYIAAVALYEIVFMSAVLLFLPVTIALTLAGGFLFGAIAGTVYAVMGATVASVLIFVLVRHGVGTFFQKRYAKQLEHINREIKQYGAWYLMVAQILPFSPTWLLNVGAGLTRMPVWTFAWATAIGLVPGTFLYALIGQQLPSLAAGSIRHEYVIGIVFLVAVITLLPILLKRYWDARTHSES